MKYFNKYLIVFVALFSIVIPSYANAAEYLTSTSTEIIKLETQLDVVESVNSKMLNSIYWTLGFLFTVFSVSLVANIYANYSLNSRKYDGLRDEIVKLVDDKYGTVASSLDKKFLEKSKEVEKLVNKSIDANILKLQTNVNYLGVKIDANRRDFLLLMIDFYQREKRRGATLNLIELLEMDITKGWDFAIKGTLEKICLHVDHMQIEAEDARKLSVQLDRLPPIYSVIKGKIEGDIKVLPPAQSPRLGSV
ncbi:MAG: hypothetical protein Q7S23_04480 [bacterium]|nr:hypothetical protein [bacterium]